MEAAIKLLVYGFYNRGNAGDELMRQALVDLFNTRNVELEFTFQVDEAMLAAADGIVLGGGSFLDAEPNLTAGVVDNLMLGYKPVFYVSVGLETAIHQTHRSLLNVAHVVATRSPKLPSWLNAEAKSSIKQLPDVVYTFDVKTIEAAPKANSVLFVPNVEVVPWWGSPHWVHSAWEQFRVEAAQFLDHVIVTKGTVTFAALCCNDRQDDAWAATQLISHMNLRRTTFDIIRTTTPTDYVNLFARHSFVVTQRFHGVVLAELAQVPYTNVHHHDKLEQASPCNGTKLSYYGVNKHTLIDAYDRRELLFPVSDLTGIKKDYLELVDRIVDIAMINRKRVHA